MSALINCIKLRHLRAIGRGRQGEISITPRLPKNLHFRINTTVFSTGRVSQGPITVNESVSRKRGRVLARETAMFFGEYVTKLLEHSPGILTRVRLVNSVMKMHLDLAEPFVLQVRDHLQPAMFILFRGKKIRVAKWCAVVIANGFTGSLSEFAPLLELN